jgi:hypothetical protein
MTFGAQGYDAVRGIAVNGNNPPVVVGVATEDVAGFTSNGGADAFIVRLSGLNGSISSGGLFGSVATDYALDVFADGEMAFVTGFFGQTIDFDVNDGLATLSTAGSQDAFVVKLKLNGDVDWQQRIGGTGVEAGEAIAGNKAGEIVIGGRYTSMSTYGANNMPINGWFDDLSQNGFVLALDEATGLPAANFVTIGWGGSAGSTDGVYGVALDGDYVLFTGAFIGTVANNVFSPYVLNSIGGTQPDIIVAKYDLVNSQTAWAQRFGNNSADAGYDVSLDIGGGAPYIVGEFRGDLNFGGGILTNAANADLFFVNFAP